MLKGDTGEFSVNELIHFVREGGRKGVIKLRSNGEVSEIYFAGGSVVSAVINRKLGGKVLAEITGWDDGEFTIEYFAPTDANPTGTNYSVLFSP